MPTKPFQLIVLAVFALLALVGLLLFASYSGFGNGSAAVGRVIIWGTVPSTAMKAGLDGLTASDKSFKDVAYVERPAATFSRDLANALASGTGPDLIIVTQEELIAEKQKLTLIPFSSFPQRNYLDTFVPMADLFLTEEGFYGIPFLVDPLVLYYNKTSLSAAGISSPPYTWEAVLGLTPLLTQKNDRQDILRSAIALGEYGNVRNSRAIISLFLLQSGNPITGSFTQGIRSTLSEGNSGGVGAPPTESALNYYTQFADPVKTVYSWNRSMADSRQEFLSGDLALYIGFGSEQPFISAANPNLDYDMSAIPRPATSARYLTYGTLYAFAIPKASANGGGAYAAAIGLTASASLPYAARAASMAPATRAFLSASPNDLYAPIVYPAALIAEGWLSPSPASTDTVFATMIENITSGRMNASEALFAADQALNAAF